MSMEGGLMRTFLLAAFAAFALAAPADAAIRNFGISSFTKIRVDGPFKVTVTTNVPPFAKANGSQNALDRVAVDVRGDTLVVHTDPSWGGYPGSDPGPVEVSVGTHDLSSAALIGAGSVAIDRVKGLSFSLSVQGSGLGDIGQVAVDQLSVNVGGTASAKLAGHAGRLTVLVRGMSALNAARLTTPNAAVTADGTATIEAEVTDTARVDAWGPATVRFTGRPSCTLKVTGSASVSGCR
jgi:hypothetical protein